MIILKITRLSGCFHSSHFQEFIQGINAEDNSGAHKNFENNFSEKQPDFLEHLFLWWFFVWFFWGVYPPSSFFIIIAKFDEAQDRDHRII